MTPFLSKLLFCTIAIPLWLISVLFVVMAFNAFSSAPYAVAHEARLKAALERRASFVDAYVKQKGTLPSQEEFQKASKGMADHFDNFLPEEVSLVASRPSEKDGFNFPPWPKDGIFYAISYWRGNWAEFYDSYSHKTNQDSVTLTTSRFMAFLPLFFAFLFGAPPFILLWFRKRKRSFPK